MGRGIILSLTVFAAALEPAVAQEPDLFRYAITQGGLTVVIFVLLYYIRALHQAAIEEKNERLSEKDERLQAMITLASEVKVALSKSLDATAFLARAVEKIEDRKNPR